MTQTKTVGIRKHHGLPKICRWKYEPKNTFDVVRPLFQPFCSIPLFDESLEAVATHFEKCYLKNSSCCSFAIKFVPQTFVKVNLEFFPNFCHPQKCFLWGYFLGCLSGCMICWSVAQDPPCGERFVAPSFSPVISNQPTCNPKPN